MMRKKPNSLLISLSLFYLLSRGQLWIGSSGTNIAEEGRRWCVVEGR
ncbi:hypothetical protein NC651_030516 [Populus alba x Populus x berolinensis]|nr:hypothetical protein NC651_030516 [Populus alba x Populus x berolinensis]